MNIYHRNGEMLVLDLVGVTQEEDQPDGVTFPKLVVSGAIRRKKRRFGKTLRLEVKPDSLPIVIMSE